MLDVELKGHCGGREGVYGNAVLSEQFFYKPKTYLKSEVCILRQIKEKMNAYDLCHFWVQALTASIWFGIPVLLFCLSSGSWKMSFSQSGSLTENSVE